MRNDSTIDTACFFAEPLEERCCVVDFAKGLRQCFPCSMVNVRANSFLRVSMMEAARLRTSPRSNGRYRFPFLLSNNRTVDSQPDLRSINETDVRDRSAGRWVLDGRPLLPFVQMPLIQGLYSREFIEFIFEGLRDRSERLQLGRRRLDWDRQVDGWLQHHGPFRR